MLSRKLAESGLYPAIDLESSVSRLMTQVTPPEQQLLAQRFRSFSATYDQNRDLISVGAYVAGSDPRIDAAIKAYPALRQFIQQGLDEHFSLAESTAALAGLTPYLVAEGLDP